MFLEVTDRNSKKQTCRMHEHDYSGFLSFFITVRENWSKSRDKERKSNSFNRENRERLMVFILFCDRLNSTHFFFYENAIYAIVDGYVTLFRQV